MPSLDDDLFDYLSGPERDALVSGDEGTEKRLRALATGRRNRGEHPDPYDSQPVPIQGTTRRHVRNWNRSLPVTRKSNAGRPKKKWDIIVETYVLEAHGRLRLQADKKGRLDAFRLIVEECRERFPHSRMSASKVRRILLKFQPEDDRDRYLFFRPKPLLSPGGVECAVLRPDGEVDGELVDGVLIVTSEGDKHIVRIGPRPVFGARGKRIKQTKRRKPT